MLRRLLEYMAKVALEQAQEEIDRLHRVVQQQNDRLKEKDVRIHNLEFVLAARWKDPVSDHIMFPVRVSGKVLREDRESVQEELHRMLDAMVDEYLTGQIKPIPE